MAYIVIFRTLGVETFGEYSLVLTLLVLGEILLDFGHYDIIVREICMERGNRRELLSLLTHSRFVQAAFAYVLLAVAVIALGYPTHIVYAALVGGIQFIALGGAHVYRSLFKATMRIERDVAAETAGAFVSMVLLIIACLQGAGLVTLIAIVVISRVIHFGVAYALGRKDFDITRSRLDIPALKKLYVNGLPYGLCMVAVALYVHLDILMLYRLDDTPEYSVGIYSAAYRIVMPLALFSVAFMGALYPILSSLWGKDKPNLRRLYQRSMDIAVVFNGLAFCGVYASAPFLMGLFGEEGSAGVPILRALAWFMALMGLGAMIGPMIVIVNRFWLAFGIASFALAMNFVLNWVLIPKYSYMGAAYATLGTEIGVFLPGLILVQRSIGYNLNWLSLIKLVPVVALCLYLLSMTSFWGSALGGVIVVPLAGLGALSVGAVRLREINILLKSVRKGA